MDDELIDEAECENCEQWFGYVIINPDLPRSVCDDCISVWRDQYVTQKVV